MSRRCRCVWILAFGCESQTILTFEGKESGPFRVLLTPQNSRDTFPELRLSLRCRLSPCLPTSPSQTPFSATAWASQHPLCGTVSCFWALSHHARSRNPAGPGAAAWPAASASSAASTSCGQSPIAPVSRNSPPRLLMRCQSCGIPSCPTTIQIALRDGPRL